MMKRYAISLLFTLLSLIVIVDFFYLGPQGIEQLKKEEASWARKSRWKSIQSVFGRFSLAWFSPFTKPAVKSKIDRNYYSV